MQFKCRFNDRKAYTSLLPLVPVAIIENLNLQIFCENYGKIFKQRIQCPECVHAKRLKSSEFHRKLQTRGVGTSQRATTKPCTHFLLVSGLLDFQNILVRSW